MKVWAPRDFDHLSARPLSGLGVAGGIYLLVHGYTSGFSLDLGLRAWRFLGFGISRMLIMQLVSLQSGCRIILISISGRMQTAEAPNSAPSTFIPVLWVHEGTLYRGRSQHVEMPLGG